MPKFKSYFFLFAFWGILASALGVFGFTERLHPPFPQIILLGLTALLLLSFFKNKSFRDWMDALSFEILISIHLTRFVGFYFLWLYAQGKLPYGFAVLGGRGDIIAASFASLLMVFALAHRPFPLWGYWLWNSFGLIDILFVVGSATYFGLTAPDSMHELLRFPLCLLPTFIVPLIIFTHGIIFYRLKQS